MFEPWTPIGPFKFWHLRFEPHPLGLPIERASHKGYSIIRGEGVNGIEVMYPDGDVRSGLSEDEVEEILFGQ